MYDDNFGLNPNSIKILVHNIQDLERRMENMDKHEFGEKYSLAVRAFVGYVRNNFDDYNAYKQLANGSEQDHIIIQNGHIGIEPDRRVLKANQIRSHEFAHGNSLVDVVMKSDRYDVIDEAKMLHVYNITPTVQSLYTAAGKFSEFLYKN